MDIATSQADIMRTFAKFGIKQRAFYDGEAESAIGFSYGGLTYRISVLMPDEGHEAFHFSDAGRKRTPDVAAKAHEAEVRRRWRSLFFAVKAKLVAVDDSIATFEQEFLAYAVTGDGRTVGEHIIPQLTTGAKSGRIPSSLPVPGGSTVLASIEAKDPK